MIHFVSTGVDGDVVVHEESLNNVVTSHALTDEPTSQQGEAVTTDELTSQEGEAVTTTPAPFDASHHETHVSQG